MLALIVVPSTGYILLSSRTVQTKIVNSFLNDLKKKVNTDISVKSVKVRFFNRVIIEDLLVKDQHQDTLIFVPKLEAELDSFSLGKKRLIVEKAKIYSPNINISQDSAGQMNFQFLIDSLQPKDSIRSQWNIDVNKVLLGDGDILVDLSRNPSSRFHKPLIFNQTALTTKINYLNSDSIDISLQVLKFVEKSGFQVKKMKTDFFYKKGHIHLSDLLVQSVESSVKIEELFLKADSTFNAANIGDALFKADVQELIICPGEARLYHPFFYRIDEKINFKGLVEGNINNFRGENLMASLGETSEVLFDIDIYGLDQIKETFYHADFKKLYINTRKFPIVYEQITRKPFPFKNELHQLGHVVYDGELTGFYNDIVSFGKLSTDAGFINTDLSIKRESQTRKIELSGDIATHQFNLGSFFNLKNQLGNVTMKVKLDGDKLPNEPFSLQVTGGIDSLEFNNYTYHNVYLRGVFGNKNFNGGVDIRDPNLFMLFTGRIDFSGELPIFNFESEIGQAYPSNLKLYNKFPNDKIQMRIKTMLQGNSIDNLTGFIGLSDIKYNNMNGGIEMENASLMFTPGESNSSIEINSDILDLELKGQYNLGELKNSLALIAKPYLPSLASQFNIVETHLNNFEYIVNVHDFSETARILELPISINADGTIEGDINDKARRLTMRVDLPDMTFKGLEIDQLDLNISNKNMRPLSIVAHAKSISMGKKKIQNFVSRWVGVNDAVTTNTVWHNDQEKEFSGNINVDFAFNDSIHDNLVTDVIIKDSEMVMSDSLWSMEHSVLNLDTSGLVINNFVFGEGTRFVQANGKLSKNKADSLLVDLKNVNMTYLSNFLNIPKLELNGIVNGDAVVYSGLQRPIILSDITINDLYINKVLADRLNVKSEWDDDSGLMNLKLKNTRSDREQIEMNGTYNPSNKDIDFYFNLSNCNVEYVQPYLESILQNIQGSGSGPMHLYGTAPNLILEGFIIAKNSSVNIDYLKTSYYITDTLFFEKNKIAFRDFTIKDRENNEGRVNGQIGHHTFKNMDYNLVVDFNKCLVLDTRERDNHLYYGTVYATGVAGISGKGVKTVLDISGKTEPNTVFKLPLSTGEVAGESDFIRFVSKDETTGETKNNNILVKDGTSGMTLNLEVEITPDAYAELIFDSRVGDVIKGRGSGSMVFKYDTYENFKMYGAYKVEKGEYLFTLQNIINKRFDIVPGGVISWSGNPYDAEIELDAYYGAKASLNTLIPELEDLPGESKRRIPVNCHMMLTEQLMNPAIKFDIELPSETQELQQRVANIVNTEDEMNKQIFSLLALNSFVTPDYLRTQTATSGLNSSSAAAFITTSEFLSNQLSNWLSQISNDFDVGVNYRPSTPDEELTSQEIEVLLSTQLFDDKVSINGNVGYRETQAVEDNNFIGDFDVDVKLNATGNLRLKAYTHTNDGIYYESKTKQGVGFIYNEEFDNWNELMETYKARKENRTKRRKEKKKQKKESASEQNESANIQ